MLQDGKELAEGGRVEGDRDAQASTAGQDQLKSLARSDAGVGFDGEREEAGPGGGLALTFSEGASPGVEAGLSQALASTKGGDSQAAGLPLLKEVAPALLLGEITWFARGHVRALMQDGHEFTKPCKMDSAGRLRYSSKLAEGVIRL